MDPSPHCDRAGLLRLLEDKSSGDEQTLLIEHLDTCKHCQNELETIAADDWWWTRASQLIRSSDTMEVCEWTDGDSSDAELAAKSNEQMVGSIGRGKGDDSGESSAFDDVGSSESWTLDSGGESLGVEELFAATDRPGWLGRVDKYEVERLIGRGGMGIVFRGYDQELDRWVAIKMLAPHLAVSGTARQRFIREARAAAAVVHEHVVAIHGIESHENIPYIVMPLVSGDSLQRYIDRKGPLPVRDIIRIAYQIAAGLDAAHRQGLVHRDIKPANILLDRGFNRVQITDFGLARAADDASLTRTGFVAGTPHYMSPEQAHGEVIDRRSDLFSLGSVIYFMATGRPPFLAENPIAVLHKICHQPPKPLQQFNEEMPLELEVLVRRLMSPGVADRIQDASQLQRVLVEYLNHLQDPVRKPVPSILASNKTSERNRQWWLRLIVIPTIAVITVVCFLTWVFPFQIADGIQAESNTSKVTPLVAIQAERGLPIPEENELSGTVRSQIGPTRVWNNEQVKIPEATPLKLHRQNLSIRGLDDEQVNVELQSIGAVMRGLEAESQDLPDLVDSHESRWYAELNSLKRDIEKLQSDADFITNK